RTASIFAGGRSSSPTARRSTNSAVPILIRRRRNMSSGCTRCKPRLLPAVHPFPHVDDLLSALGHEVAVMRGRRRAGVVGEDKHPAADRETVEIDGPGLAGDDPMLLVGRGDRHVFERYAA